MGDKWMLRNAGTGEALKNRDPGTEAGERTHPSGGDPEERRDG